MSNKYLSSRNESGANKNKESEKAFVKTKDYVLRQNNYYVGGATCWSSNRPYNCLLVCAINIVVGCYKLNNATS